MDRRGLGDTPLPRLSGATDALCSPPVPAGGQPAALDVIYLVNNLRIGGSEKKTVNVANGLAARGLKVGVAYLNGPEDLLGALSGAVQRWCLSREGKYSLTAMRRLRRLLEELRPRAVVAVNLYPLLYLAPAALLTGAGRPRTISLLNTSAPAESIPAVRRLLYAAVLGGIDHTVHGCQANRSQWHAPRSTAWERSGVIYNGVDIAHVSPDAVAETAEECRERLGVPPGRFVFGTVGRLAPEKNQRLLLDTLYQVRAAGLDAHLLVTGDGRLKETLQRCAHACRLEAHVTFTGALADVRPALKAMDVFVLPSVAIETFSNAALEAMAMERPVILSGIGGAAEMIRDRVDGFIVPREALRAQVPVLLQELAAHPEQRRRLGLSARTRVEERFSLETMLDNHMALIP